MKNVGGLERILRALFGSSLVLLDFFATIQLEIVFLILGLWGVLTSALGYCSTFRGTRNYGRQFLFGTITHNAN